MELDKEINDMIIKIFRIENASPEKQKEVVETSGKVIYQAVVTRALDEMKEEDLDEFEKITDSDPTPEKIFAFFREKIPNFDKILEEEAETFVKDGQKIASQLG